MSRERALVEQAARNNALWCDAVCAAHHRAGEFHGHSWLNPHGVPRYYPDVVTLTGAEDAAAQTDAISAACATSPHKGWAVKDSFGCLDLAPLHFKRLFDARWLRASPDGDFQRWECRRVEDERALADWERSWRGAEGPRIFGPRLLSDPDICFLFAIGEFAPAGGILNRAAGAVGISNVFCATGNLTAIWAALAGAARSTFPGLPILSYEHAEDALSAAGRAGFSPIGPLRVWSRAPRES